MDTLEYFKQICAIPRESGNEDGMRKFLLDWAAENGFKAAKDSAGNVVVYRDATPGFENVPPTALQGHMDMVCVKTADSKHDFLTDPIEVYEDGDFLRARDTSLGGDNGIAVAMVMALFTDPTVKHGPLEGIFTFQEETGMDGAFALDGNLLKSRRLINLDGEEEGVVYIGCAGGIELTAEKDLTFEKVPDGWEPLYLKICGLKGGHSGGEIHKQRVNAVSALCRMLSSLESAGPQKLPDGPGTVSSNAEKSLPFMLVSLDGGTRHNVIPSAAECVICVPSASKKAVMTALKREFENIKEENRFEEPDIEFVHYCSHCAEEMEKQHGAKEESIKLKQPEKAVGPEQSLLLVRALFSCPHGVSAMSMAVPGVVETSDNLAIVRLPAGKKAGEISGEKARKISGATAEETAGNTAASKISVEISIRSLIDSAKYAHLRHIRNILESFGFNCTAGDGYPAWTPNPDSPLAGFCAQAWKSSTGEEAVVTSIHAGLECGIINSKVPGMDSVSIGPALYDVHSVNEHLSISSTKKLYAFMKQLLPILK